MNRRDFNKALTAIPLVGTLPPTRSKEKPVQKPLSISNYGQILAVALPGSQYFFYRTNKCNLPRRMTFDQLFKRKSEVLNDFEASKNFAYKYDPTWPLNSHYTEQWSYTVHSSSMTINFVLHNYSALDAHFKSLARPLDSNSSNWTNFCFYPQSHLQVEYHGARLKNYFTFKSLTVYSFDFTIRVGQALRGHTL